MCRDDRLVSSEGIVCCLADSSCLQARYVSAVLNNHSNSGRGIFCDGFRACDEIKGSIEFEYSYDYHEVEVPRSVASFGGTLAVGDDGTKTNIKGSKFTDIYCTAWKSCQNNNFISANEFLCNGEYCCQSTRISQVYGNVWAFGGSSAQYSTINNVEGSVFCGTEYSCYETSIINVKNDIYGNGYRSLYGSNIENVTNVCTVYIFKCCIF